MEINETREPNFVTLQPIGDLDANSSIVMDEKIESLLMDDQASIHVDCSRLEYISSAGLGVFISFQDEIEECGGRFVFSQLSDNIRKVFELLGLDQIMTIVTTEEQARKEFGV